MTSVSQQIMAPSPTVSRFEKHWAWVQNLAQFDKISRSLWAITAHQNTPGNNYCLFNILDQEYGSSHGEVINQTKTLFPTILELEQSDGQAKKVLGLCD